MEYKPKASVQQQIDENLKRVYASTLEQEVPDKFAQLLAQLKEQEAEGSGRS